MFTLDSGATRNATLSNPYPKGLTAARAVRKAIRRSWAAAWAPSTRHGTAIREMYSWNVSVQREVGWNSVLEVNYTGSRGVHL